MDQPARPPLPWEEKAAIGALGLLALQEIHEGVLFCLGIRALGVRGDHAAFAVLLLLFAGVAIGLLRRSRIAWWIGLLLIGAFAIAHVLHTWSDIIESFRYATDADYKRMALTPYYKGPFRLFWVIARNVLLLAVPALLFLGELRKELRRF